MNHNRTNKFTGATIDEEILGLVADLDVDDVGVFQIIPVAKEDFGLSGDALASFVRKAVAALMDHGALPVREAPGELGKWVHDPSFGRTSEEVATRILNLLALSEERNEEPDYYNDPWPWFVKSTK